MKRLILCLAVCAGLLLLGACGGGDGGGEISAPDPAPQNTSESIISDIPEGSILTFQDAAGPAKLNKDMEDGNIPKECAVLYDQMGSRPTVVVTDPETITDIYNRLGHVIVGEKSEMSITDCYHFVGFHLQDDTYVKFRFEGTDLMVWDERTNYEVSGGGDLWSLVRYLQDMQMGEEGTEKVLPE